MSAQARGGAWPARWLEKDPAFYRQVLLVGLPVAFQQAINIGVNLMDTVMVGALGEAALSASSLANQYYYLYYILCLGISGGACVLSAQYWGAGNARMVRQVWRLSLYIAAGAAVLFAAVTAAAPETIMAVYTADAEMIALGGQYLRVTAWVFFFHGTSLIMVNLLRTVGVLYLGFGVSCLSFVSNIFFNYVFIFGKFGAPRLGIAGAAVGTLIARLLEFAVTFGYLFAVQKRLLFSPADLAGGLDAVLGVRMPQAGRRMQDLFVFVAHGALPLGLRCQPPGGVTFPAAAGRQQPFSFWFSYIYPAGRTPCPAGAFFDIFAPLMQNLPCAGGDSLQSGRESGIQIHRIPAGARRRPPRQAKEP